jgi:hypothetical protein
MNDLFENSDDDHSLEVNKVAKLPYLDKMKPSNDFLNALSKKAENQDLKDGDKIDLKNLDYAPLRR